MTLIVSAVIPAFRDREYIEASLANVFEQRPSLRLEVKVVNDGSTDSMREKAASHRLVILLGQSSLVASAAGNAGIRQLRGEFVAFLDADDLSPEGKQWAQIEYLQCHTDAALCFGDCLQFNDSQVWPLTLLVEDGHGKLAWGTGPYLPDRYALPLEDNFITAESMVVRRQALEELWASTKALVWLRIWNFGCVLPCTIPSPGARMSVCCGAGVPAASHGSETMSLAYLEVLRRQQACCVAELDRRNIDLNSSVAREYREMAERALKGSRSQDAIRWARRSFITPPYLRTLWHLTLGSVQNCGLVSTPS